MPYIKQYQRDFYLEDLKQLSHHLNVIKLDHAKGDLNYIIFSLVVEYLIKFGYLARDEYDNLVSTGKEGSYFALSTMIDAVSNCSDELKRRVLVPYEKKCKEKNGDV